MSEKYPTRVEEFNGKPMFVIVTGMSRDGHEYKLQFGVKKAMAILDTLQEIEEFVSDNMGEM